MPQRQYSKEQSKVAKTNPRVILPIGYPAYQEMASAPERFRAWLDEMILVHPELFPCEIEQGYTLHDYLPASVKLPGVRFRRIRLTAANAAGKQQVLTIAPSDVMPFMSGYTDEVEKALFLRRFGVPFWGLTYVFGRNDDDWYNQTSRLGRYELVSSVVKDPDRVAQDLLADEKYIHFNGEKGYIFRQVVDFQLWAAQALRGPALEAVEKLCAKADAFALAFDHPTAYRTSNMIDRHMIPLDRWLSAARYFHGHWSSAELQIRAWVLLHDFMPFCPRAKIRERAISPVHQLNGFVYHDNWLHNLLISTSCAGLMTHHRKT